MTVLAWFLWRRSYFNMLSKQFRQQPNGMPTFLTKCRNMNLYGCRKHPVIYNDMCRIVRGMK